MKILGPEAFAQHLVYLGGDDEGGGVDPGHGGSDTGAIGVGGLREKDITLEVAVKEVTFILEIPFQGFIFSIIIDLVNYTLPTSS